MLTVDVAVVAFIAVTAAARCSLLLLITVVIVVVTFASTKLSL